MEIISCVRVVRNGGNHIAVGRSDCVRERACAKNIPGHLCGKHIVVTVCVSVCVGLCACVLLTVALLDQMCATARLEERPTAFKLSSWVQQNVERDERTVLQRGRVFNASS